MGDVDGRARDGVGHARVGEAQVPGVQVDVPGRLVAVKPDGGVPGEEQRLVGGRDVHLLHDPGVEVELDLDVVALREQVPRQPHVHRRVGGGGRHGGTSRHVHAGGLNLEHDYHGDHAGDGGDRQDAEDDGQTFGQAGFVGHGGSFLRSALKPPLPGDDPRGEAAWDLKTSTLPLPLKQGSVRAIAALRIKH